MMRLNWFHVKVIIQYSGLIGNSQNHMFIGLAEWIPSINNMMWYAFSTCNGMNLILVTNFSVIYSFGAEKHFCSTPVPILVGTGLLIQEHKLLTEPIITPHCNINTYVWISMFHRAILKATIIFSYSVTLFFFFQGIQYYQQRSFNRSQIISVMCMPFIPIVSTRPAPIFL